MNYAVIKTGGKQYKVTEGDVIAVERLEGNANDTITFSEVLMLSTDGETRFGQPLLDGVTVTGKLLENFRGEKLRIAKYKAKVRYRRVTGHRQELTRVQIETLTGKKAEKKAATESSATEKPKRTRKTVQK